MHPSATPVWAPTGIALAALLIFGRRVWPGVAAGAFLVNYTTHGSLLTSLAIAAGNTLEAVVGAEFTERLANGTRCFLRGRDVFRFVLYAGLLSTMISPFVGVTSLALGGYADWNQYGEMWLTWWLGDVGGNLVAAPFLVLWATTPRPSWQKNRSLEAATLLLAVGVLGSFVVFPSNPLPESGYPPAFVSFPLILWAAFSFGPRGSAAAVLLLSVVDTWATVLGVGPFAIGSPNQSLLVLDSFVAVLSLTGMGLGAVVHERSSTSQALKTAERQLQAWLVREQGERLQAEATSRAKDQFLAVLGHELRSPLAALNHASAALYKLDREPQHQNLIAIMTRQTRFLARLVDDLLDVSRLDSGKVRLVTEVIDLKDPVERCVASFRASGALRDRVVTSDLASTWIRADSTRLIQVITNLLENAAKFTADGGHIHVGSSTVAQQAVLRVRDDGRGIEAKTLPHIFDFFAQADDALDRSHGGLGIGLTIVRRLVELHGGTVEASSDGLGRGSEFVVRLPSHAAPALPETTGSAARPHPGGPLRVLVIEDYDDSREALEVCLRMLGHEVRSAEDGNRGVELALEWRPHVGLVDIGLPGLDGYEVAKQIRASAGGKDMRLFAITGYGEPHMKRRALEAGFDDCMVKPVDPDRIEWMLSGAPRQAAVG